MSQLPLALSLDKHAQLKNFVIDGNKATVAHIQSVAQGLRSDVIWIWGAKGTGKSHILQGACSQAGQSGLRSMYLNVANEVDPSVLTGLESMGLLAIDNVDRVARSGAWDEPLFHLLNEYYRGSGSLLLAADCPPGSAGFHLADLASRAAGAVVYRLHPLSDEGQLTALMLHARVRGLELDAATAGYLFMRVKREMTELCEWLDYIDKESLAAQRKVTIPFVRQLLEATPS